MKHIYYPVLVIVLFLIISGCGPTLEELENVRYLPVEREDWQVSTPAEQGLDPLHVARMYYNASRLESIYSLLIIKNGYIVAEDYFHDMNIQMKSNVQSVTKSFTSACVGIAIDSGYIKGLDQKMIDFFPELAERIKDSRKREITIQQMLQMRAGYPWEESSAELFKLLYHGFSAATLVAVPLNKDPGSGMEYSNLTAHLLGIIVARSSGMDLKSFAEKYLLQPLDINVGKWIKDWDGNYLGYAVCSYAPRDLAKFGLLYLHNGKWNGKKIVPASWVADSFSIHSQNAWPYGVGSNFNDISYGYQWWNIRAGKHRYNLAWGHGGQQIAVVKELDMVIVVTADDLAGRHGDHPWDLEKSNLNVVADFIASLP